MDTLRRRYEEFRSAAEENQLAVMRYYTPRGEEVRVAHVSLYEDHTLLFRGEDQEGNPCDVIAQPQSAQVVLKLLTFSEPVPPAQRRPIGFYVDADEEETR